MNSLLNGLGQFFSASKGAKNTPNILMQAIGAAMRGEDAKEFMRKLAETNPQLKQYANQINVVQGFNALQQSIAQLGYQMDQCCCSIKTQMLQDKYEELENRYRTAQNDLSNANQSQYILSALGRFVAYPPAATASGT